MKEIAESNPGCLTKVVGGKLNVYSEGVGEKTLVFMAGGGTVSPLLDFKVLYSQLTSDYRVVVVEKFGYGFSDLVDKPRDLETLVSDTRSALKKNNLLPPYVLCPHSMSGIEAMYWAEIHPEEITAIIGLDMATPAAYADYQIHLPFLRLVSILARTGIVNVVPKRFMSDAIKLGNLTDQEVSIYQKLFRARFLSKPMLTEMGVIKQNALRLNLKKIRHLPTLLFVSNGSGTGLTEEQWQRCQHDFHNQQRQSQLVLLACPHYVHQYQAKKMAVEIRNWLEKNG